MAHDNSVSSEELVQLVSFKLDRVEFGIDIRMIREINRMVEITKVPQAPSYCEGVINLRGNVIPVIDLRKKLDMEVEEWTKSTRIVVCDVEGEMVGMVVDAVEEVLRIPGSTIEPAPKVVSSVNADYISGIAKLDNRMLIFLDISKITSEIRKEIDHMAKATA